MDERLARRDARLSAHAQLSPPLSPPRFPRSTSRPTVFTLGGRRVAAAMAALQDLFAAMEAKKRQYVEDLREIVCIPSVSSLRDKHYELVRAAYWFEDRLKRAGARTELCYQEGDAAQTPSADGDQALSNVAGTASTPPVLLAWAGRAGRRRTVCVYCHLDVHPVESDSVWRTDPFRLCEREGALWGRGASASKGPALCWLHVLEAYKERGDEPPVNLRLIFDTAAEVGSPGLEALLRERRRGLLRDVEFVCVTTGQRVGHCMSACHAARGLCYFHLAVAGAARDAHSGACGGVLHEPLADLLFLLDSLHTKNGRIAVAELLEDVVQLTADEEKIYSRVDMDVEEMRRMAGGKALRQGDSKLRLLVQRWRMPTITLHGVDGAFADPGGRPVIPRAVVGKFSVRLVANQRCERVARAVRRHLEAVWAVRRSPNCMTLHLTAAVEPWAESTGSKHFQAAMRALRAAVPGSEPEPGRLGGSVPGIPVLQALTGRSVVALPLGGPCDAARGHNENFQVADYMRGHRVVAAYIHEIASMK